MTHLAIHFVDPTIPGLSGRDLVERAVQAVQASVAEAGRQACNAARALRRDRAIRRDLAHLDRHILRDIGLDRDAI